MAAVEGLEALVARIAAELDAGRPVPAEAYVVCKVAGAEWLWRAADDLVQFLGGRGYIETNVAAQLLRDARVTRILEGPTEPLTMFLGSRAVNDSAALRVWLADLGGAQLAARLATVAGEIEGRCLSGSPRYGGAPEARRWAYALIGQVAVDAVLLAATPAGGRWRLWAEERFEATVSSSLARAGANGLRFDGADLRATVEGYHSSVGDIEQTLAGEDHTLDAMLRRRPAPKLDRPVDVAAPAPVGQPSPPPVPLLSRVLSPPPTKDARVERV